MTKKRYHKLFASLMIRMMDGCECERGLKGRLLKASMTANPTQAGVYTSYQEAWEGMLPLREKYSTIEK